MRVIFIIFMTALACTGTAGEITISAPDRVYHENFDGFQGTFSTLPQGFSVSKNGLSAMPPDDDDFRGIKTDPVTVGGCYAWHLGGNDYTLGCQPIEDDFTPGWFMLSISNACITAVKNITVSYELICRNDASRSSRISFEYSCSTAEPSNNVNRIEQFDFTSPETAENTAGWTTNVFSGRISLDRALPSGGILRCTWKMDDYGGSGPRDEYGINNLMVIFHKPAPTAIAIR